MQHIQHKLKIISNEKVTNKFYHLKLEGGAVARAAQPGQFVNLRVCDGLEPLFRRPFGVYRCQKDLEIFYEVRGGGTHILMGRKSGEIIDILGPLGKPFSQPPEKVKNVVMIAGGIGIAPLMALSDSLKDRGLNCVLLYGGRDKNYVFDLSAFEKNGCKIFVATDDGCVGQEGRVSVLFDKIPVHSESTFIYTCGPRPMMASVQQFAQEHNLKGECSCEEVMACGVGACLGCVIETINGYKTVCHDGPVFELNCVQFKVTE